MNGGEHARAEGIEGEREMDLAGEGAEAERERGGEWEMGSRRQGRGGLIPLPASAPARRSGGDAPLF